MISKAVLSLLLCVAVVRMAGHTPAAPKQKDYPKRCAPKVVSQASLPKTAIKIHKGEKYQRSPLISFEILETGVVTNATVKRNSGVADADRSALEWVRSTKYNNRPGCGVIATEASVDIDFY